LAGEPLAGNGAGLKAQILLELADVRKQAAILIPDGKHISWLEMDAQETRLCPRFQNILNLLPLTC
jgi:hypothetical protein